MKERVRCVAVTNDISIKGKTHWFNGIDVLTDSDGCENLIDSDFAKFELCLPIHTDQTSQADIVSQEVGGRTYFREYVETTTSFKGKQISI